MTKRKPIGGRLLRKRRLRKKQYRAVIASLFSADNPVCRWVRGLQMTVEQLAERLDKAVEDHYTK